MIKNKGCFITLEGGEGSGKTTLLHRLAAFFNQRGHEVLLTREPGGSPLGEFIRKLILEQKTQMTIGSQAELLLFLAARAQHIEEKIRPALESGQIVICDRFNDSTIAYQGGARGLGVEYVQTLCQLICGPVIPKLTFFLRVSPEIGLARSKGVNKEQAKSGELDRIESEALPFHAKIQDTFDFLAKKEPKRIYSIDADQVQEAVFAEAITIIEKIIPFSKT